MWSSNNLASLPGREGGGLIKLINPLKPGNEAKNNPKRISQVYSLESFCKIK